MIKEEAPAKINLALHVTGRREDGYHLLDSLVTFADFGDTIVALAAAEDVFSISGPFAAALADEPGNLATLARDRLRAAIVAAGGEAPPVALHLEKNLPVASGIGGGSADAAAALRGLSRLWQSPLSPAQLGEIALSLGADVPMCLAGRPLIAQGVGADLASAENLPPLSLLLVNPLKPVSTPDVFRRLEHRDNAPMAPLPEGMALADWAVFLAGQRNDLEAPARLLVPDIGRIITLLGLTGAQMARMSGSGATCFGLFDSNEAARTAGRTIRAAQPGWFVQAVNTIAGNMQ